MNKKRLIFACVAIMAIASCKDEKRNYSSFLLPESGAKVGSGVSLAAKIEFADPKFDSVVYFLDTTRLGLRNDTASFQLSTSGFKMGNHLLTAKIYQGTNTEEVTSNIVIVAAAAPKEYAFKIINTYPHDVSSYTEGLEFHDRFLYESTGQKGESKLLKINLNTGKPIQQVKLEDQYFGEGLTVVGNKIIQLTWQEQVGFVYDKTTFKKLSQFSTPSGREGWGLAFDGNTIYNSCGTSVVYLLDKDTYRTKGSFEVYDHNGSVDQINELEFIEGKIYANIYKTDGPYANKILIIDPNTGAIESVLNLIGLNPEKGNENNADYILNGIAYDKVGKRLFVTGKKWSKLFEIQQVER